MGWMVSHERLPFYLRSLLITSFQVFQDRSLETLPLTLIKHSLTLSPDAMHEKCLYLELFWSEFSRIRTEYEEILHISPYSVRMRENADQNNSKYGPFEVFYPVNIPHAIQFQSNPKFLWRNVILRSNIAHQSYYNASPYYKHNSSPV